MLNEAVVLDSALSVNIFRDLSLLTNVKPSNKKLKLYYSNAIVQKLLKLANIKVHIYGIVLIVLLKFEFDPNF